MYQRKICRKQK